MSECSSGRPDPRRVRPAAVALAGLSCVVLVGCGGSGSHQAQGASRHAEGTAGTSSAPEAGRTTAARIPKLVRVTCPAATVTVHTAAELQAALDTAHPGSVISLADATYTGQFTAGAKGSAAQPIFLCGSRQAVLDGGSVGSGIALHLDGASYWRLSGFTVRDAQKGVLLDDTSASIVDHLDVGNTGEEAIHLRTFSSGNAVQNNTVHDTGRVTAKYGEGIYVGSARSNWCRYTSCDPDRSDANLVAANTIGHTTAENVDIKEGTTGGVLQGNTFDAAGMSAADSWVDVKGNGWRIQGNTGDRSGASSIVDGYQTHRILSGWGTDNVFTANTGTLSASGYGFHLTPVAGNVVKCNNEIVGAGRGLSNTGCVS